MEATKSGAGRLAQTWSFNYLGANITDKIQVAPGRHSEALQSCRAGRSFALFSMHQWSCGQSKDISNLNSERPDIFRSSVRGQKVGLVNCKLHDPTLIPYCAVAFRKCNGGGGGEYEIEYLNVRERTACFLSVRRQETIQSPRAQIYSGQLRVLEKTL